MLLNPYRFASAAAAADPYWASVVSLLHLNPVSNGQTFTADEKGLAWTFNTASLTTDTSRFGSGCLATGGSGWISTPMTSGFDLSSGDYTIEMWVKPSSLGSTRALISTRNMATGVGWQLFVSASGGVLYQAQGTYVESTGGLISTSVFKHVAVTRSGSTTRLFIDGVLVATGTVNIDPAPSESVYIGRTSSSSTPYYYAGHIDEVRITKGVARYLSSFTPSASQFPNS